MTTRTHQPALDESYIPTDPGVEFSATFPNPLDGQWRTFVTLADAGDNLLETTDGTCKTLSRKQFAASGSSTTFHLQAIREKIARAFPHRSDVRRLPRSEQFELLDALFDHLETADHLVWHDTVLDTYRLDKDGHREWLIREQYVMGFNLWDTGYMPTWTITPQPVWTPPSSASSSSAS